MLLDNVKNITNNDKEVYFIKKPNTKDIVYEKLMDEKQIIFNPSFTSEDPALVTSRGTGYSSSQVDGEWSFTHAYLSEGWDNTDYWECDFDLMCTGMRYIGLNILCGLSPQFTEIFSGWEGPLLSSPPGNFERDNNNSLSVLDTTVTCSTRKGCSNTTSHGNFSGIFCNPPTPWVHINIKKISSTGLIVTKTGDDRNNGVVCFYIENLPNYTKFTIGARNNTGSTYEPNCGGNKVKIKNLIVKELEPYKLQTSISMSSNKNSTYYGETFSIVGTLLDETNKPVPSKTVNLVRNGNIIGTTTTLLNGLFSFTKQADMIGTYQLEVEYSGDEETKPSSDSFSMTTRKLNTSLTISFNKTSIYYSESVIATGTLKDEFGNPISDYITFAGIHSSESVRVNNGEFSYTFTPNDVGEERIFISYNGNSIYNSTAPTSKTIVTNKAPVNITINAPNNNYEPGDIITIDVSSNYGSFVPNEITVLFNEETTTLNTKNSNGLFEYTIPTCWQGSYSLYVSFNGTSYYQNSSAIKTINIVLIDSLTIEQPQNRSLKVHCKKNGNYITLETLDEMTLLFTDSNVANPSFSPSLVNGIFTINFPTSVTGTGTVKAKYHDVESNTINLNWS